MRRYCAIIGVSCVSLAIEILSLERTKRKIECEGLERRVYAQRSIKARSLLPIKRQGLDIAGIAAVVAVNDGDEFAAVVVDLGVDLDLKVPAFVCAELAYGVQGERGHFGNSAHGLDSGVGAEQ